MLKPAIFTIYVIRFVCVHVYMYLFTVEQVYPSAGPAYPFAIVVRVYWVSFGYAGLSEKNRVQAP